MDKTLTVQGLPETLMETQMTLARTISIPVKGDSAVYARATLEDGHVAWSSPIYSFRSVPKNA